MRRGGGNVKGGGFERDICVRLSLWITDGQKRDCFWRSAISGGRATAAFKRGERLDRQSGDITSVSPEGFQLTDLYFFELKFRKYIGLEAFLLHNKGPMHKWWAKTCQQASQHGRRPVLIAKANRSPIIIITNTGDQLNRHPIARLAGEDLGLIGKDLGLLERTLKTKWNGGQHETQRSYTTRPMAAPSEGD